MQIIPLKLKIPVQTTEDAHDIAMEIIIGGIDMLSDKKLSSNISCEMGDVNAKENQ